MVAASVWLNVSSITLPAASTAAEVSFGTSEAVLVTVMNWNPCASFPAVPWIAAFVALALSTAGGMYETFTGVPDSTPSRIVSSTVVVVGRVTVTTGFTVVPLVSTMNADGSGRFGAAASARL